MPRTTDNPDGYTPALQRVIFEDPSTSTRELFTKHLTDVPMPSTPAHDDWLKHATLHQVLLEKLALHPAMAPNLQQTYNTPANNKNNVYFMWDFVGRTLGQLFRMDPELPRGIDGPMEDVVVRTTTACNLILDVQKGMLDEMTESQYPEQRGKHPAFGEEILALAREMSKLKDSIGEGCEVCARKTARDGSGALFKCGGCKEAQYCSVQCQKRDWKRNDHKGRCKNFKGRAAAAEELQKEWESGKLYEDLKGEGGVGAGVKEYVKEHPQYADQQTHLPHSEMPSPDNPSSPPKPSNYKPPSPCPSSPKSSHPPAPNSHSPRPVSQIRRPRSRHHPAPHQLPRRDSRLVRNSTTNIRFLTLYFLVRLLVAVAVGELDAATNTKGGDRGFPGDGDGGAGGAGCGCCGGGVHSEGSFEGPDYGRVEGGVTIA
ncbi:hypothetical protein P171DRAFT_502328 [Karstenula rhodostoma CBS 690.94]|uniref:MYND-type domain-containing protein n=1 Tax=Karstenula rhodostoma CBS 690.94 TaxID=1392251 RepID=A0A9P4P8H3_9PLEO|nr:hypothetical protein P171DRAFT_502328 [Karstenula rhodostoma CBS 690.94]